MIGGKIYKSGTNVLGLWLDKYVSEINAYLTNKKDKMTTKIKSKSKASNTEPKATKVKKTDVALVEQLTEVRAEIARLEKLRKEISEQLDNLFDEGSDLLIHQNLDVLRRDWRERESTDDQALKEMVSDKIWNATRKKIRYSVLVSLYKSKK
jgi:hypothetical protein